MNSLEQYYDVDSSGCWIWNRSRNRDGYGKWRGMSAHRAFYLELVGPIAPGLEVDHLCRVTSCVNPDHMEAVTKAENNRRKVAARTECRNGHPYDAANTYVRGGGHGRGCRACNRVAAAAYRLRRWSA